MAKTLIRRYEKNPKLPGAELLPILKERAKNGRESAWPKDKLEKLLEGLRIYGKDWNKIAKYTGSKSSLSLRS